MLLLVFKDNQVSSDNVNRHVLRSGESRVFSVKMTWAYWQEGGLETQTQVSFRAHIVLWVIYMETELGIRIPSSTFSFTFVQPH